LIVSRTPLRMSFAGGGSDLSAYYERYGGAVLSASIDKYVYVTLNKKFDKGVRLSYSVTELSDNWFDIKHPIVRASVAHTGVSDAIEITTIADIPSAGTGLGSSSSFTVGLLNALYAARGDNKSRHELAREACEIEIDKCGETIGKQDQFAAAYGGINFIQFEKAGGVQVEKLSISDATIQGLKNHLLVFYTGITRKASGVLAQQVVNIVSDKEKTNALHVMVDYAHELRRELLQGNIDSLGSILHQGWLLKKSLQSDVSSKIIDSWYDRAIEAGAIGGKILGAGGGGFFLFYANKKRRLEIIEAMALEGLRHIPIDFDTIGTAIVYDEGPFYSGVKIDER
jgi:D-glycero-alpha-D-manno-heptose-7-phosphate kinase